MTTKTGKNYCSPQMELLIFWHIAH